MAGESLYQVFFNWLFDGDRKSPIPKRDELLKYNSPITNLFIIKLFINHYKLNYYLNNNFNNFYLFSLEKEDMFLFAKQCVRDFKIKRNGIHYYPRRNQIKLLETMKVRFPFLKVSEIELVLERIENEPNSSQIYSALGIEKPMKQKIAKKKVEKKEKMPLKQFLCNFNCQEIK